MSEYNNLIQNNSDGIFMITKDNCDYCDKLKQLFDTIEVDYNTHKYIESEENDESLPFKTEMKNVTGGKFFPFCYFNGEYVGGYKEIHRNLITGGLKEKLNAIGIDYEEDF